MSTNGKPLNDITGKIYHSNNCGDFEILGEIEYVGKEIHTSPSNTRYALRFLNTGYVTDASLDAIRHGRVYDRYTPNVAGVGYIGTNMIISDPYPCQFYKAWNDMMNRCYNKADKDYPLYGGIGIAVDPRWHNFSTFMLDVPFLPLYEKKLMYPSIYQLDKDFLQIHVPKNKRIYSRNTCIWLSKLDNVLMMSKDRDIKDGNPYVGVVYSHNCWKTVINGAVYGKFNDPKAAANLFNYLYPKLKGPFNDITILNNVEYIPLEELSKYIVGSTTIQTGVEPPKTVRSNSTPPINFTATIGGEDIV